MNSEPICFVAPSTQEVVAQIRSSLGPEAVVLNVRPIRPPGLARFWQKPMIEVLACRPQREPSEPGAASQDVADLRRRLARLEQQVQICAAAIERTAPSAPLEASPQLEDREPEPENLAASTSPAEESSPWRVGPILQEGGLLPVHAQYVADKLGQQHGANPPAELSRQLSLARAFLTQSWRPFAGCDAPALHVFVGAPGSGKTTCLCKWLSQIALVEGRMAHVWRLDGAIANLAQNLTVYCEVLGVAIDRFWERSARADDGFGAGTADEIGLIDIPGVDWRDALAVKQLALQLKAYGACQVHLVVNAAYEPTVLLSQIQAFSALPITDLIVTHLDEEPRWGRIWNLVLGTNYTIGYLSAGQNIPGEFCVANPETIMAERFHCV